MENPYAEAVSFLKQLTQGGSGSMVCCGTVKMASVQRKKLTIVYSGIEITEKELLKNSLVSSLSAGDNVILLSFDGGQQFIILCKVVPVYA